MKAHLSLIFDDRRWWIEEVIDAPPLHKVLSDQPCEGEEAFYADLHGVSNAQEQECNQGDGKLNAYGILGSTEEMADFEGMLNPAEEQLDLPAALVEIGDLVGRGVEIVGDDAQDLACLGPNLDLAHGVLERVLAGFCLSCRQKTDPVGEHRGAFWHIVLCGHRERCVDFEAGDEAAACGIEIGPP